MSNEIQGGNARLHVVYCVLLAAALAASSLVTRHLMLPTLADHPVYLVGSVTITDPERLPEYQAVAGPLAAQVGGYLPLAFAEPQLIEGRLPMDAIYFIERYDSLEGLQRLLESEDFRQAKKLRDKVAEVHFMMWLPAVEPGTLPH
jgi:uncharacterized protein (DUF1330 family)